MNETLSLMIIYVFVGVYVVFGLYRHFEKEDQDDTGLLSCLVTILFLLWPISIVAALVCWWHHERNNPS